MWPALILWMVLRANEIGMVAQLHDFTTLSSFIVFAHKLETSFFDGNYVLRIDFVTVAVSLVNQQLLRLQLIEPRQP